MAKIFVSYRRIDSRSDAGRLFDRLQRHFGSDAVFMDVEKGIPRGADFGGVIERAAAAAVAFVVVIGPRWLTCTDDAGARRIDAEADWVRNEVLAALRRRVLLLPVLVNGATMPAATDLPLNIQALARLEQSEITDSRWDYDVGEIVKQLETVVPAKPSEPPSPQPRPTKPVPAYAGAAVAAGIGVAVLVGLVVAWPDRGATVSRHPSYRSTTIAAPKPHGLSSGRNCRRATSTVERSRP